MLPKEGVRLITNDYKKCLVYKHVYKQGDLGENIQSYGVGSMVFSTKDSQSTENPCIDSEPD